jgi:hypothetical protein
MVAAKALFSLVLAASGALGHPHGVEEKIHLHAAQPLYRRTLSHCQEAFQDEEFVRRTIERRTSEVVRLKKERGLENGYVTGIQVRLHFAGLTNHSLTIHGRQFDLDQYMEGFNKALSTDHHVNKPFNKNTKAADLFGSSGACMTTPEVTEGPLCEYADSFSATVSLTALTDVTGEQIRRELTEGEGGVKVTVDIQVVDVKTCKPLQNVAVDFWSCNATVGITSQST